MTQPFVFTVPGDPIMQLLAFNKSARLAIRAAFLEAGGPYFDVPVEVYVTCHFPRPKLQVARKSPPFGDVGDILQIVIDALAPEFRSGFEGAWPHSRNVEAASVRKYYTLDYAEPHTTIQIFERPV